MRRGTLIVLAALALAQLALLLLDRRRGEEQPHLAARVLQGLDRERVTQIRLEPRGAPAIALRRTGATWRLVAPISARADRAAVEELLSACEFVEAMRTPPPAAAPPQLGLEPPAIRVLLEGGGHRHLLAIGAADPSQQGVYVEVEGRRLVAERAILEAASRSLDELRDRELLRLPDEPRRLQRQGADPVRLERSGRELWLLEGEARIPALPAAAERLLRGAVALRASRFLPTPPAATAGALRLESSSAVAELRIGGACPGRPTEVAVAASREGAWQGACVERDELTPLQIKGVELRDPALTRALEPELALIRLRAAGGAVELTRQSGAWTFTGQGAGEAADPAEVRAWVEALAALRGTLEVTSAARPAAKDPRPAGLTIELGRERGGVERILIGPPTAGPDGVQRLPVRREGARGVVLWLPLEARAALEPDPLRFRNRQVTTFSRYDARRIQITRGVDREEVVRSADGWEGSAGTAADPAQIDRLLERLTRLRARRFLTSSTLASTTTIRLRLEPEPMGGPARSSELRVELAAGDAGSGCRGRVDGGLVFELEEKDCDLLRASVLREP